MLSDWQLAAGAALLGFLSHIAWFIHGEHDFLSRRYLAIWTGIQATGFFFFNRLVGRSLAATWITLTAVSTAYLISLFTSIIVYRVFFHRLNAFPGPLSWKITKFTHAVYNTDFAGYRHLDNLHKQYGQFVRTGPREISIVHPAAATTILGPGSKCRKAVWYDMGDPLLSVHQCRDKKLHDIRRKIWDKGFSAKSLRDYESRVTKYADLLVNQLKSFGGGRINASRWLNYYSFDVMGDLAFGESFHMLETGEFHFAIALLQLGMESLNIGPAIPWLFYIFTIVPLVSDQYYQFIKWSGDQAERRKRMKVSEPDIMTHLIDAPLMSSDESVNKNWQDGDARLIIVAGSDTTSAALTYCVGELIKHPHAVQKLREEVKPFVSGTDVDYIAMQNCQYLNAVIDETLRLYPPVPAGLIRTTPDEGITIGDTYIPGDVNILIPLWSNHRSSEAFVRPDEFVPERWCSQPELVKKKNVWAPFSMGAFGCVGRNLAYMEMRTVISRLVTDFDLAFADNEDGTNLIMKSKDHFTLSLAEMWITCKPRSA